MKKNNSKKERIVVFYSIDELNVKDIEKEVFTKDDEHYHIFFFHNLNLHFSKTKILRSILLEKFELIEPEMEYFDEANALVMTKIIPDVNFADFDTEVDADYDKYLEIINYRIDCIFQTFIIFNKLYNNKSLIYYFPIELYERFSRVIKEHDFRFADLDRTNGMIERYDVFYWADYFSRLELEKQTGEIRENNIVKILFMEK